MGNTAQLFPLLSDESKQNTRFTPANENLTLQLTFSVFALTNQISIRKSSTASAILHIPGVLFGIADTADVENSLPTPIQAALILNCHYLHQPHLKLQYPPQIETQFPEHLMI